MDPRIKKTILIAFSTGAGIAVVIAALGGGTYWYLSGPKPPKPWNTTAIVADGTPGFASTPDGQKIRFTYSLDNTTISDYRLESSAKIKLVSRENDGTLSQPIPLELLVSIEFPVFIPAKQKGTLPLVIHFVSIPQRKESETDEQYHETLRAYCLNQMNRARDLVLFDERNRYEISLPKPAAQPPRKAP
jgi:hypothetical protein